jgi:thiamine-monophosphate kinase
MASRPLAAVVALALPRQGGMDLAVALYEGMLPLAELYDLAIAGGDTNAWDGPLVVSVTAIGLAPENGPLRRAGARPGDRIVVSGAFGGSILGRHLDFQPRVHEALLLKGQYEIHAGIDASDGISTDLGHLIEESGCGAAIEAESVPISDHAFRLAESLDDGSTPLEHALDDGEDFELILAVPPEEADRMLAEQPLDVPLTAIGRFVPERGLWLVDREGRRREMRPGGYEHRFR